MIFFERFSLFALRVSLGWLFFYAGITKVLDPSWSAEGYLRSAKMFPEFYSWLASPEILPIINIVNEWGLTLLGISLIFGVFVRVSSLLGAFLMLLYYLPAAELRPFEFFPQIFVPYIGEHSVIVDEHIIYIFVLLLFAAVKAGRAWGLDKVVSRGHTWLG
jgi:thiosulfate dehydrogenase (quinone) large subunit